MTREIRYLVALVLAICVSIAVYDLAGRTTSTPARAARAGDAPAVAFTDAAGGARSLPASWAGTSKVSPALNLSLDTELTFVRLASGAPGVRYTVGDDRGPAQAAAVTMKRRGDASVLSWRGPLNEYELSVEDGATQARLLVARNRVRYLVPVMSHPQAQPAQVTAGSVLGEVGAVIKEGWFLLRPRLIGLLVSYAFVAGIFYLIYWKLLRKRLVHRRIQREDPRKGAVLFELKHSFLAIVAVALFSYGLVFVVESGHSKLYRDVDQYGWPYWFFSLALLLVLVDAYVYWTHRFMHHRSVFRYFHKIHHHSFRPTPWATFSVNINEIIVNALFMPVVILVIPVHQNTTIVFALVSMLKNVTNHLGFEFFPLRSSRNLLRWIVTPTFHELHHMKFNCNYSAFFTWWDKWMGTEHAEYHEKFVQVRGQLAASPEPAKGA